MENSEGPDHPIPASYRHISVTEIDDVILLRFADLRTELEKLGSYQETYQEFSMLASHHQECLVVLDPEGQDVSAPELFICYLVWFDREVKQVKGTLKLRNLSPLFAEAMRMIRLNRMFSVYESLDEALLSRP